MRALNWYGEKVQNSLMLETQNQKDFFPYLLDDSNDKSHFLSSSSAYFQSEFGTPNSIEQSPHQKIDTHEVCMPKISQISICRRKCHRQKYVYSHTAMPAEGAGKLGSLGEVAMKPVDQENLGTVGPFKDMHDYCSEAHADNAPQRRK